ncbi:sulfotransferase 2B1-like [Nelusetta ayraudi]|uniref:sulfotransferase 2B1-like n=1 Tax=Nelusetta ayraudi TaxID=303726 RepID=UPI003F6E79B6
MTEAELYSVYKGVYLSKAIYPPEALKYYEEFSFRKDDVIIVTYPRSGTIWAKEIVPLILSGGDPASVGTVPSWHRVPWLEVWTTRKLKLEQRPSPRMFASHFHYNMMPPSFFKTKPKVIYIMRNPKDVFTSSYYFFGSLLHLVKPGPLNEFLHKFLDGKVMFGSWFDHVKGWLSAEDKDRILYISYEEMIADLKNSLSRIAQFLEKPLEADVLKKIAEQCLFSSMKKNKMSNYSEAPREFVDQSKSEFLRKGIAGDWKKLLTEEEAEHFDAVYKEKMKDVKYKFVWD